ncbi:hypothetical protein AQUCO_02700285v1 [Aquilegia coerulea]|uniref:KIB1-4 beta-propeller domain-containing protein n=1 Tax=Aquilegia coerulea TaxID=218851 RepID=A0A2G5D644_AQUCA|nr:hypothetical protein AQUCO_02700285v1 [Aquilegia coerulea]
MAIKRKHCMIEEKEYSLWHLVPHDVLWMIIERLDLIACDCVSAVCGNWRSVYKSYRTFKSSPMPKDTIPWLMTRKNNGMEIELYQPSTNRTYKIDMPEINGTDCLYSKDGWLLLHELLEPSKSTYENIKLCLINLFTRDKMELPELKTNKQIFITKGTFSTYSSNCPKCVIIITGDINKRVTVYAWTEGSDKWKGRKLSYVINAYNMTNIWLCDTTKHLYCFTTKGDCFAFNTDLKLIPRNIYPKKSDKLENMTVCGDELFAISMMDTVLSEVSVYKFPYNDIIQDDWLRISDVSSMIIFKNDDISFMVREECTQARSLLLNNLKKHGCQIIPSTKKMYHKVVFENESYALFQGTVYQYDRSIRKWVKFKFNNLMRSSEDIGIIEREQQMKAKEQLLVKKLQNVQKVPFIVCGTETGISTWINVG